MKKILICLLAFSPAAHAQEMSAEDSVKMAVNKLFVAMRTNDSALLVSAFADNAILQTIHEGKNGTAIKTESITEFGNSIASAPKGSLDEQIVYESIKIDGPLASVWTPYKFFFNGKLSHCGANSFQMVRFNNTWKIQYLTDTRRRNCE